MTYFKSYLFILNGIRHFSFYQTIIIKYNMKRSSVRIQIFAFIATLITINAYTNTTFPLPSTTNPSPVCNVYCMYTINNFQLVPKCTSTAANGCTQCDPLLFRPVVVGAVITCTPHLYNNQQLLASYTPTAGSLGYITAMDAGTVNWDTAWKNSQFNTIATTPAHYAIRIRFSVYLHKYSNKFYTYGLLYAIDDKESIYNQTTTQYWSEYDIITSEKVNHTASTATIIFRNMDKGYPYNTDGNCNTDLTDGTCRCSQMCNTTPFCTNTYCSLLGYTFSIGRTCCQLRYIQITQVLVFISKCETGCKNCTDRYYCTICDGLTGYFLNPVDNRCYTTCPQATYKDNTTLFLADATINQIEYWCSACNKTCMECENLTYCTKCYPYGRNESFLYNNTCLNLCLNATCTSHCPNGYEGNYTNHSCYCPLDYHYEVVSILMCYLCSIECILCTGPSNLQCTKCQKGYYLINGTTFCSSQCPSGQYPLNDTNHCYNCDPSCVGCALKSTLCTNCQFVGSQKYLLGSQCLSWCPDGYSWNNFTSKCDLCNLFQYSYLGKCIRFCPSMYTAHQSNRSCIHMSKTNFTFDIVLKSISILSHGKLMKFTLLFQDGLNSTSYNSIIKKGYFIAKISYKDSLLSNFNGVRTLYQEILTIRNLNYSNNYLFFYTLVPQNLDYHKSFQITFLESIAGSQNITYANLTNTIHINQYPQLLKEFYNYTVRNNFHLLVLPLVVLIFLFFFLQIKGMYELYIEFFRILQVLGLVIYSSFPIGQYVFYFLIGCSYANLDFMPNIYAMYATSQKQNNFASFFLMSEDMNFVRLNGSVLSFGVVWIIILLICNYLLSLKEQKMRFMIQLGYDLMQVKIIHSFWSSLLFLIVNYINVNFSIFITFCLASFFLLITAGRRVMIYRQTKEISPFFFWRLIVTFVICFISLANELVIGIIFILSICISLRQFYLLHSEAYLININNLTSFNYMSERTFKVLNNYDQEIPFCMAIPIRNMLILLFPILTSILISLCVLLKDSEKESIYFATALIYFIFCIVIISSIFLYKFLVQRRKYLVENKLQYLKNKYSKLNYNNENTIYVEQQRRRPRINNTSAKDIDDEKYLQIYDQRNMMKNLQ